LDFIVTVNPDADNIDKSDIKIGNLAFRAVISTSIEYLFISLNYLSSQSIA